MYDSDFRFFHSLMRVGDTPNASANAFCSGYFRAAKSKMRSRISICITPFYILHNSYYRCKRLTKITKIPDSRNLLLTIPTSGIKISP